MTGKEIGNETLKMSLKMSRLLQPIVVTLLQMSFCCFAENERANSDSAVPGRVTLADFLNKVAAANLDYAAQRYTVSIAKR
jgi:hypothetical protein